MAWLMPFVPGLSTVKTSDLPETSLYGICCGQGGTGTVFPPSTLELSFLVTFHDYSSSMILAVDNVPCWTFWNGVCSRHQTVRSAIYLISPSFNPPRNFLLNRPFWNLEFWGGVTMGKQKFWSGYVFPNSLCISVMALVLLYCFCFIFVEYYFLSTWRYSESFGVLRGKREINIGQIVSILVIMIFHL